MNEITKSGLHAVVISNYDVSTRPSLSADGHELKIISINSHGLPDAPRWLIVYEGPELFEGDRLYNHDEETERKLALKEHEARVKAARVAEKAAAQAAEEASARLAMEDPEPEIFEQHDPNPSPVILAEVTGRIDPFGRPITDEEFAEQERVGAELMAKANAEVAEREAAAKTLESIPEPALDFEAAADALPDSDDS